MPQCTLLIEQLQLELGLITSFYPGCWMSCLLRKRGGLVKGASIFHIKDTDLYQQAAFVHHETS